MTIAELIRAMTAAGAPPEAIAIAVEAIEEARAVVDEQAERRRAADRERKKRVRGHSADVPRKSADVPRTPPSPAPPKTLETPPETVVVNPPPSPPTPPPPSSPGVARGSAAERYRLDDDEAPEPEPPPKGKAKRGTRIPEDWELGEAEIAAAKAQGFPSNLEIRRAWDEFKDYWRGRAGKDGVKQDWPATWRNRCRQIAEQRGYVHGNFGANGSAQRGASARGAERLGEAARLLGLDDPRDDAGRPDGANRYDPSTDPRSGPILDIGAAEDGDVSR